nr:TetR family transcriptional regulator [Pseudarthrobacter psychrotolerans]
MKSMSRPYADVGRTGQKRRTLDALVAAARQLVADGATPTVDDAALLAGVARSTAYRYFPGQRDLLAAAHPETAAASLLPENPPTDVAERLDAVVTEFTKMIVETEAQQRTMLRLSLEQTPDERRSLP